MPSLSLRTFDYTSAADCALAARWLNDPEIRHLSSVFRSETDFTKVATAEEVASWDPNRVGDGEPAENPRIEKHVWMLLLDGVPVGDGSVMFNPPHAMTKEPWTAWFGITIGEASARGRGFGRRFFTMLEEEAISRGATQGELGVFEFNDRAIRLYESLGYTKIGSRPEFTWWRGKMWADLRYLKRFRR